jgi:hypothetical protein
MGRPPSLAKYQALTAAQQFHALQRSPICAGHGSLHSGQLVWNFTAQPTPLSRIYDLRIVYRQGEKPLIYVISPDLPVISDGRKIPHLYEQKPTRLCLYYVKTREWASSMLMTSTIVPWAILWLFYFEEWLFSGEWKGGGIHPGENNDR